MITRNTDREVSIHAPNEGSDTQMIVFMSQQAVSIHAPNEGSDRGASPLTIFLTVSIHAPNEGSDRRFRSRLRLSICFNPRSQ